MSNPIATQAQDLTYDSLITDIIAYSERNDDAFNAQIPRFILLAEKEIAAEFKTFWELRAVQSTMTANTATLEKPARWRKTVSITVNGVVLTERTQEYITLVNRDMSAGQPLHYSEVDYKYWGFAPVANMQYPMFIQYFEQAQPLSKSNQTNLISSEAPQLLLFACMLQSAYFLKDQTKIGYWQNMYGQASAALNSEDQSRVIDRNTAVINSKGA